MFQYTLVQPKQLTVKLAQRITSGKRPSTQPQLEESIPRPRSSSLKVVIFKLEDRNLTIIKNRPLQGRNALFVFNYLFYLTTI